MSYFASTPTAAMRRQGSWGITIAFALAVPAGSRGAQLAPAIYTDPQQDKKHPARMEVLQIPTGGVLINGVAYTAAGAGPHPTMILFHGLPGDEKNLDLAQAVRRAGWNVVTLNYRGSWGSPGTCRSPAGSASTITSTCPECTSFSRRCRRGRSMVPPEKPPTVSGSVEGVVRDAVCSERVSWRKFPVRREFTGNSAPNGACVGLPQSSCWQNCAVLIKNSLQVEQGNCWPGAGTLMGRTAKPAASAGKPKAEECPLCARSGRSREAVAHPIADRLLPAKSRHSQLRLAGELDQRQVRF